jgi:hypothetical protein
LRKLEACLSEFGGQAAQYKLEALDSWLSDREESSICVAAIGDERRCSIRAHGREFEAVSQVTSRSGCGGWFATWAAICSAVARAEAFERAFGDGVG